MYDRVSASDDIKNLKGMNTKPCDEPVAFWTIESVSSLIQLILNPINQQSQS
jgi:hypothetical protein